MEVEQPKLEAPAMTFDEASLERSKSFVKALQELKNLRPQLYSAAEYCEKSYLHSEQKQMVLDNLKDYAVRALVNAVDHLGTVAYKLSDLLEQQTVDVDTMDLKVTCLNQQILTCQTYMDKEGLRQQRLLAIIPRHHKRYILPSSVNKKVHFTPSTPADPRQTHVHARPRIHPSASPQKTLSWHLASETKPSTKRTRKSSLSPGVQETSVKSTGVFNLLDNTDNFQGISPVAAHLSSRIPLSGVAVQPFGAIYKDPSTVSKTMTPYRSFDNSTRQQQQIIRGPPRLTPYRSFDNSTRQQQQQQIIRGPPRLTPYRSFDNYTRQQQQRQQQIIRAPPRTKSVLSAFFARQKTPKLLSRDVV